MKTKIMVDSVSFMPKEYMDKNNIACLEVYVNYNDSQKKELSEVDLHDFIEEFPTLDPFPKTSMATPDDAIKIFEQAHKDGYDQILYLFLTPEISGQANVAKIASRKVKDKIKVHFYPTDLVGASQGALVLYSQQMLEKGKSVPEIIKFLDKIRTEIITIGISKNFSVLFKSGKIKKDIKMTLISSLLNLKPLFHIPVGKGVVGFGAGSGFSGAIKKALKEINDFTDPNKTYNLILTHSLNLKLANKLEKKIKNIRKIEKVDYWIVPPAVVVSVGDQSAIATLYPILTEV
ncbi:MAG: DegV family protein [Candidatus Heimdallarchaeaceae archaeon]